MSCCFGFETNTVAAQRVSGQIFRGIDYCEREALEAVPGSAFAFGTPVKWNATLDMIEPALDGVDAIGLSLGTAASTEAGDQILVQFIGRIYWSELAPALGFSGLLDAANRAAFLPIRAELMKSNIYVEFK